MKKWKKYTILALIILYFSVMIFHQVKPLPHGVDYESPKYSVSDEDIEFLYDLTYRNHQGETVFDHHITDKKVELINNSQNFAILNMFLFNEDFADTEFKRETTRELTDLIIENQNETNITFITDEINTFYGSYMPEHLQRIKDSKAELIFADRDRLRDSNILYTPIWRIAIQWFGNSVNSGWLPHPLGNPDYDVTVRSYLDVANFKANHRKVMAVDNDESYTSLVTSSNPHTPSSNHTDTALVVNDSITPYVIESERGVADYSESSLNNVPADIDPPKTDGPLTVQYITERKIADHLVEDISNTKEGEHIKIAAFYLSDREIINELKDADDRGVDITLILDSNVDAFGRDKAGIPNRQVAFELFKNTDADIYWYKTKGEQFHPKMTVILKEDKVIVNIGSSNLTKRNLQNYNLESNVKLTGPYESDTIQDVIDFYNRILENEDGIYTVPYEEKKEHSIPKYLLYRFQESSGMTTH